MVQYDIIRSSRTSLILQVKADASVVVRAPFHTPTAQIRRFVQAHEDWIHTRIKEQREKNASEPSESELLALIERAKAELPPIVSHYSALMGLYPTSIKITRAKTRAGSCNHKNGLCFSCRLMRFHRNVIEYVVVHELAHIAHKNHKAEFYALIARYLPDYKERRAALKRGAF